MSINTTDFAFLQTLVRERSAIVLDPGKEYLAESRLAPIARGAGLPGIGELVAKLRTDPRGTLTDKVIEAMTTNETSFFRDVHPFEALRLNILPDLIKARANERTLNLWCAASSSGQEPYTIAMLIRENFPALIEWRIRFIATDISQEMLRRSRDGIYSQLEVNRGLPAKYLVKYFEKRGSDWQIKADLRSMIEFKELNLIKPWPAMPPLDVVFIRNVLIYFDLPTKRAILGNIRKVLRPDGYLFLGGAETTLSLDESFKRAQVGPTWCYRL
ncbi:MAG: protein-glutamate O-methyltransferase CheR [Planctomycetota bacterium]